MDEFDEESLVKAYISWCRNRNSEDEWAAYVIHEMPLDDPKRAYSLVRKIAEVGDPVASACVGADALRSLLNNCSKEIGTQFIVDVENDANLRYAFSRAAMFGSYTVCRQVFLPGATV